MKLAIYLKCAAAAAILAAGPAALAKNAVHSASPSASPAVRSSQSLPTFASSHAFRPSQEQSDEIESAAAEPPYCSGNKYGIYRGEGEMNGNGLALTCAKSPG